MPRIQLPGGTVNPNDPALRAAYVATPAGGTDGQALVKSGTAVAWGAAGAGNGGAPVALRILTGDAQVRQNAPLVVSSLTPTTFQGSGETWQSGIASGTTVPWTDPRLRYSLTRPINAALLYADGRPSYACAKNTPRTVTYNLAHQNPLRVHFTYRGRVFAFGTRYNGSKYRIWVNGQPLTAAMQTFTINDNSDRQIRVDLGSRAEWDIAIEGETEFMFRGLFVERTGIVSAPKNVPGPRVAWMTDSFGQGGGVTDKVAAYPTVASRLCGWGDIDLTECIGSTGYVNLPSPNNGGVYTYPGRISSIIASNPDIVVMQGSRNDTGYATAGSNQIRDAAVTALTSLRAGLPDAWIICTGPIYIESPPTGTYSAVYNQQQLRTAYDTVFGTPGDFNPAKRVMFIDTTTVPPAGGSGNAGIPAAPVLTLGATVGSGGTFAAGSYFWKVTAFNAVGETVGSNEVTATLAANGTQALSWTNPGGNDPATGYKVYRGTAAGAENALVATVSSTTLTYTDTGTAGTAATVPASSTAGQNAASDGPADYLRSADLTHPDPEGHQFLSSWFAGAVQEYLRAYSTPWTPAAQPGPTSGTVLFSDQFTRADSTTSLGGNWANVVGTWGITSNQAVIAAGSSQTNIALIDAGATDYVIDCDITMNASGSEALVFAAADANNYFDFQIGATTIKFERRLSAGSILTSASTTAMPLTAGTTYHVTVRKVGGVLTGSINGTQVLTYTMTGGELAAVAAYTKVGLSVYSLRAASRWDNFTVTAP